MPGERYKLLHFNKSYNYLVSSTVIIFCIGSIHLLDIEKYASVFEILFCYLFIFKYTRNTEKKKSGLLFTPAQSLISAQGAGDMGDTLT